MTNGYSGSKGFRRLIREAPKDHDLERLLLKDPFRFVTRGYKGDRFNDLHTKERELIKNHKKGSLDALTLYIFAKMLEQGYRD